MATAVIRADKLFLHQVVKGDAEKVKEMLRVGRAQVNAKCQYMQTPLHWAASYDHGEVCKALLEAGARVDCTAVDGCTPLHFAAREGCGAAVSVLLKHGADASAKNNSGSLPIQLIWDDDEDADIVEMLIAAGGGYPMGTSPAEQQEQTVAMSGTGARKQVADACGGGDDGDQGDYDDGKVERIIEATVIETRSGGTGTVMPPPDPNSQEATLKPGGRRCMAIGTDTDFPDAEGFSASCLVSNVSVVFGSGTGRVTTTSSGTNPEP